MSYRRTHGSAVGIVFAAILTAWSPAPAQQSPDVTYTGSVHYSTGEYLFTERSHSVSLLSGLQVRWDRIQLSASMPVIYQTTPWISTSTGTPIPTGGPRSGTVRDSLSRQRGGDRGGMGGGASGSIRGDRLEAAHEPVTIEDTAAYDEIGAGDPMFGLSVTTVREEDGAPVTLSLRGDLKVPVADADQGFGTGQADVGAGGSVSRQLGDAYIFTDLEYWAFGDMPDLELKNALSYAAGVGHVSGSVGVSAMFSGYTRILEGTDPPMTVSGGLSVFPGETGRTGISFTAAAGLTESSPDFSLSAGWTLRL